MRVFSVRATSDMAAVIAGASEAVFYREEIIALSSLCGN
jgi:hypothetical protein